MLEAAFYLASAFWLGALHAATPGHGKTVTAAYLVGARGRVVDAITLGVVVTLAHTGGIVAFGILATLSSSALLPQQAEGYLALATGSLIVVLGLWMLWGQRHEFPWRTVPQKSNVADHPDVLETSDAASAVAANGHPPRDDSHHYDHHHDRQSDEVVVQSHHGPHADDHDHAHRCDLPAVHQHEGGPAVATSPVHFSVITPGAGGNAVVEQSAPEGHSHAHWHGWGHHHHPEPALDTSTGQRPSFGLLLGLGIAGGVLPDPAALAVLLAAIANGTLVLGLMTVLVFSLGFASVLVIVGLIAARASRIVLDRIDRRWAGWLQFSTSMLVVLMGVVMTTSAFGVLAAYG